MVDEFSESADFLVVIWAFTSCIVEDLWKSFLIIKRVNMD